MIDILLSIMSFMVFLIARLLKENVRRVGKNITLLSYSAMFFFIFLIGGAVDNELLFEKTAYSVILIYIMVIICAVYVWKTVSNLQDS